MTTSMVAVGKEHPIAIAESGSDALEILAEARAQGIRTFDFDQIKVPTGGAKFWSVPSIDGERAEESVVGVIMATAFRKSFWRSGMDESGGGTPPDCFSLDGQFGQGDPGGPCESCEFNVFGTARGGAGKGKACQDRYHVLFLQSHAALPLLLSIPPASLKEFRKFITRLAGARIRPEMALVSLGLKRVEGGGGPAYSQITFALVRRLGDAECAAARAYAHQAAELLARVSVVSEERGEDE